MELTDCKSREKPPERRRLFYWMRLKWYFIRRSHKNKTVDLVKILEKIAMTLEVTEAFIAKNKGSAYNKK